MKKLLIALVLVSCNAMADTWVMANNGNGQIVITDRLCQGYKHIFYAYSYSDRAFLEGCWAVIDGKVHIEWNQKVGRRVYEMNDFVPEQVTPKKPKQQGTSL